MTIKGVTFDWWGTVVEIPAVRDVHYDEQMQEIRVDRAAEALADAGLQVNRTLLSRAYDAQTDLLLRTWNDLRDLSVEEQARAYLRFLGSGDFPGGSRRALANRGGGRPCRGRCRRGCRRSEVDWHEGCMVQHGILERCESGPSRRGDPRACRTPASPGAVAMKATAVAHPIQGLIKYHGLADPILRLPFHDSISVCTAPLTTRTTIEFGDGPRDQATIDGRDVTARDMERIRSVVDAIRAKASLRTPFRMASVNDFPSNIGLGASASGFAALAMAAANAAGLHLNPEEISRFARRGAGSAARSVTGGFSKWKMGLTDEDSYATQLAGEDLQIGMVVAVVRAFKQTEDAHREALTSPFFHARLAEMPRLIAEMELAIRKRDIGSICGLAERDTLMLHGITMTGTGEMVLWQPDTLRVILAVRRLREQGIPAFFSIDTGATVYVNTFPDHADPVRRAIREPIWLSFPSRSSSVWKGSACKRSSSARIDWAAFSRFAGFTPAEIDQIPPAVRASRPVKA